MIDQFTREKFEAALPVDKKTQAKLWLRLPEQLGWSEYRYAIPIGNGTRIVINSSIPVGSNLADGLGENSIRAWIEYLDGEPAGNKIQRWVTRIPDWETRLQRVLRALWKLARTLIPCRCGGRVKAYKNRNTGVFFLKCQRCRAGRDLGIPTKGFRFQGVA